MKKRSYISDCIRQIAALPPGDRAKFDIDRLQKIHRIGLARHESQPMGQALYNLHALGVPVSELDYVAGLIKTFLVRRQSDSSSLVFHHLYFSFLIPKKNGSFRIISAPCNRLKKLQKFLLPALGFAYEVEPAPSGVHGFRRNHSNVSAAKCHLGADCVVKLDIKDFFPSITKAHVKQALDRVANGLEIDLGWLTKYFLMEILTIDDALPTGAPTSPLISNILLKYFDRRMIYLANRNNLSYSRFADDITISGSYIPAVKMIKSVKDELLLRGGFQLNKDKVNVQRKGRRQTVCGVVVNDKPSLGRDFKRKLRAAKHRSQQGLTPHLNGSLLTLAQLQGHLAYMKSVYGQGVGYHCGE